MDVADDVIWFLEFDQAVDAAFYDSFVPAAKIDRCVTVQPYGGLDPLLNQGTGEGSPADTRIERPRFQVAVRAFDPEVAKELALDIHQRIVGVSNRELNGTWYLGLYSVDSEPRKLKVDDQERTVFSANYEASKAASLLEAS